MIGGIVVSEREMVMVVPFGYSIPFHVPSGRLSGTLAPDTRLAVKTRAGAMNRSCIANVDG